MFIQVPLALVLLTVIELIYFKLAYLWNIIDNPNARSSHSYITIRGGGIVFLLAFWAWNIQQGWPYVWASLGLLLVGVVSIWDDIRSLPNRVRLTAHISGVLLLMYDTGIMDVLPIGWLILVPVVVIGTLNAYNFMDGINGITGLYSLTMLLTMAWLNEQNPFLDPSFFVWTIAALVVFLFFNFRKRAKCFAGDVGSMGIGFIVLFALSMLILQTGELKYILFVSLYGMDTVLTIIQRLYRKENIFKAHRLHFYQLLVNEHGWQHRVVSVGYALVQLLMNILIIRVLPSDWTFFTQGLVLLLPFTLLYVVFKMRLMRKYA
ncbi:MAG: glycosyltransferase family 4 protein [Sphingobacteriaceae bacterium]|nr:glycosyltransferase family 4 protein [Sphingobacteriaceae bacterium]